MYGKGSSSIQFKELLGIAVNVDVFGDYVKSDKTAILRLHTDNEGIKCNLIKRRCRHDVHSNSLLLFTIFAAYSKLILIDLRNLSRKFNTAADELSRINIPEVEKIIERKFEKVHFKRIYPNFASMINFKI